MAQSGPSGQDGVGVDMIVAVPSSGDGLERLVKRVSEETGLKYWKGVLGKTGAQTKKQKQLSSANARQRNVRGAFEVGNWDLVKDKNILLIDDVMTTGNTVAEARDTLLKAGARSVKILVLGKTGTAVAGQDRIGSPKIERIREVTDSLSSGGRQYIKGYLDDFESSRMEQQKKVESWQKNIGNGKRKDITKSDYYQDIAPLSVAFYRDKIPQGALQGGGGQIIFEFGGNIKKSMDYPGAEGSDVSLHFHDWSLADPAYKDTPLTRVMVSGDLPLDQIQKKFKEAGIIVPVQSFAGVPQEATTTRYYHVAPEGALDSILGEKTLVSEKTNEAIKEAKRNIQDMLSVQQSLRQSPEVAGLASEIFHNRKFFNVSSPVAWNTLASRKLASIEEKTKAITPGNFEKMPQLQNDLGDLREEISRLKEQVKRYDFDFESSSIALGLESVPPADINTYIATTLEKIERLSRKINEETSYLHGNDIAAGLTPEDTLGKRREVLEKRVMESGKNMAPRQDFVANGSAGLAVTPQNIHPMVYDAVFVVANIKPLKTSASGPDEIIGHFVDARQSLGGLKSSLERAATGLPVRVMFEKDPYSDGERFRLELPSDTKLKDVKGIWDRFAQALRKETGVISSSSPMPMLRCRIWPGGWQT